MFVYKTAPVDGFKVNCSFVPIDTDFEKNEIANQIIDNIFIFVNTITLV